MGLPGEFGCRRPCAAARSCWPAPAASGSRPSPAPSAAATRRSATPSAPSTADGRGGAGPPAPPARTPSTPPSTRRAPSGSRALLHRAPRDFGHPTSVWTLELAAEVGARRGDHRRARQRRDGPRHPGPARACAGGGPSTGSPAPTPRTPEKTAPRPPDRPGRRHVRTGRSASPTRSGGAAWRGRALHAWTEAGAAAAGRADGARPATPSPRRWPATACSLRTCRRREAPTEALWLRFVDGRPVSAVTTQFLAWCCRAAGARRG